MDVVTVICTKRPWMWNNVLDNLSRQTRKPDLVVVVAHKVGDAVDLLIRGIEAINLSGARCMAEDESVVGDLYQLGFHTARICRYPWNGMICMMDDDDWYGPHYLEQVIWCKKKHPDAVLIGKQTYLFRAQNGMERLVNDGERSGDRCRSVAGPTIAIDLELFGAWESLKFPSVTPDADHQMMSAAVAEAERRGLLDCDGWPPFYSTSPSEFVYIRYADPSHEHTWRPVCPSAL